MPDFPATVSNFEHYHWGLGLLTPAMVHFGLADQVLAARQRVLTAAYAAHPERFVRKPPTPLPSPDAVSINPPAKLLRPASETISGYTNFEKQLSQTG